MKLEQHEIPKNRVPLNRIGDFLIIIALSIVVFITAGRFDILERIVKFARRHEQWELDEIITVSIFLVIALALLLIQRWRDLLKSERELKKKMKIFRELSLK